jgi:hypothetical protein
MRKVVPLSDRIAIYPIGTCTPGYREAVRKIMLWNRCEKHKVLGTLRALKSAPLLEVGFCEIFAGHQLESAQMRNCERKDLKLERKEASATIAGGDVERRAVRFQLQVPVILEWTDLSGSKQESVGRTRDISIFGAFVICGAALPRETLVSLEVQLPPLERNTLQRLLLKASGKVTRASENEKGLGIALSGTFSLQEVLPASSAASLP